MSVTQRCSTTFRESPSNCFAPVNLVKILKGNVKLKTNSQAAGAWPVRLCNGLNFAGRRKLKTSCSVPHVILDVVRESSNNVSKAEIIPDDGSEYNLDELDLGHLSIDDVKDDGESSHPSSTQPSSSGSIEGAGQEAGLKGRKSRNGTQVRKRNRDARILALSTLFASVETGRLPLDILAHRMRGISSPADGVRKALVDFYGDAQQFHGLEKTPLPHVYSMKAVGFARALLTSCIDNWPQHSAVLGELLPASRKGADSSSLLTCVIRLALAEIASMDTPPKVVACEAAVLAKGFCDRRRLTGEELPSRTISSCIGLYLRVSQLVGDERSKSLERVKEAPLVSREVSGRQDAVVGNAGEIDVSLLGWNDGYYDST